MELEDDVKDKPSDFSDGKKGSLSASGDYEYDIGKEVEKHYDTHLSPHWVPGLCTLPIELQSDELFYFDVEGNNTGYVNNKEKVWELGEIPDDLNKYISEVKARPSTIRDLTLQRTESVPKKSQMTLDL
jgi:hypothetical protein